MKKNIKYILFISILILIMLPNMVFAAACSDAGIGAALRIIGTVIKWIKIVAPVSLAIMGIVSLSKAVLAQDDRAIPAAVSGLLVKLGIGAAIIFLPSIVFALIEFVNLGNESDSNYKCIICIKDPKSCDGDSEQLNAPSPSTRRNPTKGWQNYEQ